MPRFLKRLLYEFCVVCRPHRSFTVRIAFPLMIIVAGYMGAAAITSTNESYVTLTTNTSVVQTNETFAVTVRIYGHEPINAIDLKISFPDDQVEVIGIDAGESVITLWTEDPYFENNIVYLRGGTFRRGFSGEHFIARIDARALQSGVANISAGEIQLLAGDGSGTEIPVSESISKLSTSVQIANENGEVKTDIAVIKVLTDIDGDGGVTLQDISRFMAAWRNGGDVYDFNADGRMTFRDFSILLSDSFFK